MFFIAIETAHSGNSELIDMLPESENKKQKWDKLFYHSRKIVIFIHNKSI